MVNFYRRFLPNCAQILKPLTDLLKGGAKTLEWTVSVQEAFQDAKRLLAAAVPLKHPAPNAELSLATDASDTHIGGQCCGSESSFQLESSPPNPDPDPALVV